MSFTGPFDFQKGDLLEGMTIVSPLVRGGHGDLYLVNEDVEQKKVLKVIQRADNDGELTGIEKCRAVSSHIPGLVPILKVGKLPSGRIWCVMPPADNLAQWPNYEPDTLANRIARNGRLQPEEVLRLADKMLATVRDLHRAGLAHCDIKPDNIVFLDKEPKLTDYSLLSDTLNHLIDAPFGTTGFVPPEMTYDSSSYEPRACDLYAIGKVIYCAWSGMDAMLFPSVPKEIPLPEIGIILPLYMKACSESPNRRFRNADEFISAVADARSRLHESRLSRGRRFLRKSGRLLPVLPLLIALCAAVLLFFFRHAGGGNADQLVVTTPWDSADENDGANSLREAVAHSQIPGGPWKIRFDMPDGDTVYLPDPTQITPNMRFSTTNERNGHPVDIVLNELHVADRVINTSEEVEGGGAALHANTGRFVVKKGTYERNLDRGTGGAGGAFRMIDCDLTIDGTVFLHNGAFSKGGALNLERTRATIRNAQFLGNEVNGFGGAINLFDCQDVLIVDSCFENNSTGDHFLYGWCGGAIQVEGSKLVYEVSEGLTIINEGNRSGHGGFIAFSVYDRTPVKSSGAEFRIDGVMIIGDGDGKDSIASSVRTGDEHTDMPSPVEDISAYDIFIRKTGKGFLSINAPVDDYDGQWFIEEGSLVFTYDQGGDLDGAITISGGQLSMDDPYKFKELTFRLGKPNERPFIRNLFNLTGGSFIIDAANAEDGTYPLANGTDSFIRTFTLRDDVSGGSSGTKLSVGQTVTIGGSSYTLSLNGGTLSLTKSTPRD
ncbi:MAG: hypothetical protein IKC53_02130 [Lentisphaeria bacterium]|nr:hypothetical protein [Lentisphaeria bacterium]